MLEKNYYLFLIFFVLGGLFTGGMAFVVQGNAFGFENITILGVTPAFLVGAIAAVTISYLVVSAQKKLRAAYGLLEIKIKERTKELERQSSLFEAVFRDNPDAMIMANLERHIVMCNPAFTRVFGYQPEEVLGNTTSVLYENEEEYEKQGRVRFNLSAEEKTKPYYSVYRRKSGELFPAEVVGTTIKDRKGNFLGYIGVVRDVTERRQAERKAASAQMLLIDAIESIPDMIGLFDADDRFVLCNKEFRETLNDVADLLVPGTPLEEILQASIKRGLIVEENPEGWIQDRLSRLHTSRDPVLHQQRDGRWVLTYDHKTNDGGTLIHRADVTALKKTEQALRESELRLRAILDNAPIEIYLKDADRRYEIVNKKWQELYGYSQEQVVGKTSHDVHPAHTANISRVKDLAVMKSGLAKEEIQAVTTTEGNRILRVLRFPIKDEFDVVNGIGIIVSDITEQHEAEEALRLSHIQAAAAEKTARKKEREFLRYSRLVAINEMGSAILHEISTPIQRASANAYVGLVDFRNGEATVNGLAKNLEDVVSALENVSAIQKNIRNFMSGEERELEATDLNTVVSEALTIVQNKLKELNIKIDVYLRDDLPLALINGVEFNQVLINLINNGIDSMEKTPEADREIKITANNVDENIIQMEIHDRGCGIPIDIQKKIFSSFETTKSSGIGMGLSICRSIMEGFGGSIRVESDGRSSSIFYLTMPIATSKART